MIDTIHVWLVMIALVTGTLARGQSIELRNTARHREPTPCGTHIDWQIDLYGALLQSGWRPIECDPWGLRGDRTGKYIGSETTFYIVLKVGIY